MIPDQAAETFIESDCDHVIGSPDLESVHD